MNNNGLIGLLAVIVIVVALYVMSNRHLPGDSPGDNLKSDVRSAGHDLKDMGRDAADAIRNTVR